jgi:hypothetical protein
MAENLYIRGVGHVEVRKYALSSLSKHVKKIEEKKTALN